MSFGGPGTMYTSMLRLHDGRVLMTYTMRCNGDSMFFGAPPNATNAAACQNDGYGSGLRALVSDNPGTWDFRSDVIILKAQNDSFDLYSSGCGCCCGYGTTIQLADGSLVTPYVFSSILNMSASPNFGQGMSSYGLEVVRWRLPATGRAKSDDVDAIMTTADLNALQANLPARGGAIRLNSSATIVLDAPFVVTKPLRLYGDGTATVLKAGGSIESFIEVVADGVSLEDLRLEGSKSGVGGTIMRGVLVRGRDCSIRRVAFSGTAKGHGLNFGVDAVSAVGLRVEECRFERGVSSDNNGAAILLEASQRSTLSRNVIDSSEFVAADGIPSAAIMLSAFAGGLGCVDNVIEENEVLNHPQVGIAMQSTTYVQFRGPLGECSRNDFVRNIIRNCGSARGDEAGAGVAIVSNSHYNRLLDNRITNASGFGISLVGVYRGDGKTPGTPKLTEIPSFNQILDNLIVGQRGSEKVHVLRTANTTVRDPSVPTRP